MRYILLLTLLAGCSQASGYEPDTNEAAAIVAAQIAFYEPQQPSKPDVQTKCKECKGTKQVLSGDKLSWVACSCGDNCQCVKTSEPPKQDSRLVVTIYNAKDFYCGACEVLKSNLHQIPEVQFVVHSGPDPWWIEAYPTLHWTGDDGEEYQLASGDINLVKAKLRQHNPSLFPVQEQTSQVEYYYQPTRKGRRFFGCANGRCR